MIGSLKHSLILQKVIPKRDEGAAYNHSYHNLKTIQGNIKPLNSKELIMAMGAQIKITHRIRVRYDPEIKAFMRLLYEQRILTIKSVINEKEEKRYLTLYCEEESA